MPETSQNNTPVDIERQGEPQVPRTPAEELGLIDGKFPVMSNGAIEDGWFVKGFKEVTDPETGLPETAVLIGKPVEGDPSKEGVKTYRLSQIKTDIFEAYKRHSTGETDPDAGSLALGRFATAISQEASRGDILDGAESIRNPRLEKIFAPVEAEAVVEPNYDHLFSLDEEMDGDISDAGKKEEFRRGSVTKDSEGFTLTEVLPRFDEGGDLSRSEIASIVAGSLDPGTKISSKEAMINIRSNKDLRLALGEYFLRRQELFADVLPARVADSSHYKSPPIPGYDELGKIKSREYVALLALAMLDGTFSPDKARSSDFMDIAPDGKVIRGQHRAAATEILFW